MINSADNYVDTHRYYYQMERRQVPWPYRRTVEVLVVMGVLAATLVLLACELDANTLSESLLLLMTPISVVAIGTIVTGDGA